MAPVVWPPKSIVSGAQPGPQNVLEAHLFVSYEAGIKKNMRFWTPSTGSSCPFQVTYKAQNKTHVQNIFVVKKTTTPPPVPKDEPPPPKEEVNKPPPPPSTPPLPLPTPSESAEEVTKPEKIYTCKPLSIRLRRRPDDEKAKKNLYKYHNMINDAEIHLTTINDEKIPFVYRGLKNAIVDPLGYFDFDLKRQII